MAVGHDFDMRINESFQGRGVFKKAFISRPERSTRNHTIFMGDGKFSSELVVGKTMSVSSVAGDMTDGIEIEQGEPLGNALMVDIVRDDLEHVGEAEVVIGCDIDAGLGHQFLDGCSLSCHHQSPFYRSVVGKVLSTERLLPSSSW